MQLVDLFCFEVVGVFVFFCLKTTNKEITHLVYLFLKREKIKSIILCPLFTCYFIL